MSRFPSLDLNGLKSYSINDRPSKVSREAFARPWIQGGSLKDYLERLPGILAADDFIHVVDRLAEAVSEERTIILAMGGHPVKVGLSPLIIDLMQRGVISLLAVNGSVMVHDTEVALVGRTSEDVSAGLAAGHFGTSREANQFINQAVRKAAAGDQGLGLTLGQDIIQAGLPHARDSLFAAAAGLDLPMTVHVALGTDVYHVHPEADGASMGRASFKDFHTLAGAVATLKGGVFLNLGSAVIMPEVFLKAVTLVRNLGYSLEGLTTVNMDFISHYRPRVNVVQRPVAEGGRGYNLIGHHELMFPLLAAALIERL